RRRTRQRGAPVDLPVRLGDPGAAGARDAVLSRSAGRRSGAIRSAPESCVSLSFTVPDESAGTRLDVFLVSVLAGHSPSTIQRLIKDGHVRVDGGGAKANQAMKPGQAIAVDVPEPSAPTPQPEALPLPILYQDRDVIVIDKPAGMVVHPAAGHSSGTL